MRPIVVKASADCVERASRDQCATETNSDTVRTSGGASSMRQSIVPVRPHLFIVLECDGPLAGGVRYELTDVDEIVSGRGRARSAKWELCGGRRRMSVTLPGRSLSSVHARIMRHGTAWVLE